MRKRRPLEEPPKDETSSRIITIYALTTEWIVYFRQRIGQIERVLQIVSAKEENGVRGEQLEKGSHHSRKYAPDYYSCCPIGCRLSHFVPKPISGLLFYAKR